ncbi:Transcriptional regulator [Seminavis robusta]|uniref:Transcriptional regulator n=1 Tax=Seminavis robusta TaxID=568900 RepID=A0A9N8HRL5_9STRA|nr:Transcriptional regulator [Seminavis robusta]|eukprot:Sro1085_g239630.1 Transcriptional regulator (1202) ;mRNA; f:26407-30105
MAESQSAPSTVGNSHIAVGDNPTEGKKWSKDISSHTHARPTPLMDHFVDTDPSDFARNETDNVSVLSTLTEAAEASNPSSSSRSGSIIDQSGRSSARFIKPHAGSDRQSLTRAESLLTINTLRFDEKALYGRESEIQVLTDAFDNAKGATVARQWILLMGSAGVGKSALAFHALKPIATREAALFFSGKFDQASSNEEPYAAFTMICRQLCDALLAHKEDEWAAGNKWTFTFEEVQSRLKQELEEEVLQVLTTVFPDLLQLVGTDESSYLTSSNMGYLEAKHRFNYAFRRLIRVLTHFGRVVLVIDDIQWADAASLHLIQSLLTDHPNCVGEEQGLLVVATVRSDEVNETHPLTVTLRELESMVQQQQPTEKKDEQSFKIHRLEIGNLELDQVNQMLMDLLSKNSPSETMSLAECVHRKTQGNVFYVKQFLKSLASDHSGTPLLVFQMGKLSWQWDVDEIQVRESATKNVVQVIQSKLQHLPEGIRLLLPVIALLGASFEYSVLERVLDEFNGILFEKRQDKDEEQEKAYAPDDFIKTCVHEGLLVHNKRQSLLKWEHDKVQEAALTLTPDEELTQLRYKLGDFLITEFDQKELEAHIFVLVNLLDEDTSRIPKNNPQRLRLADMNLTAGNKAMQGAAFQSAATYLTRGIQLLPEGHWESNYQLSLDLFSSSAEAHHCSGNRLETKKCCNAVIAQDRPILEKERAYTVLLDAINDEGNTLLAQEKCVEVLALLGCKFPKYARTMYTIGGIFKTEVSVRALVKKIPTLPVMTDPAKQWAMRLLDRCATYAFQNKSDLLTLIILRQLKYTLKYGYADYSPPALCTVGLLLAAALNDLEGSKQFGELGLNLYDKNKDVGSTKEISPVGKSRTLFCAAAFCLHWQEPTTHLRKMLVDGYNVGLRSGDVESAMWSIFSYLDFGFYNGLPLAMIEKDCAVYTQQMNELGQSKHAIYLRCLWQLVLNLLGKEDNNMAELNGSVLNLKEELAKADKAMGVRAQVNRQRLVNAFWSGDFVKTCKLIEETGAHKGSFYEAFAGSYVMPQLHFNLGLAFFAAFKQTKKLKYKRMANAHAKKIYDWAKNGNPNVVHSALLLQAESKSLQKAKFPETIKLYKEAILLAGRQGFLHDQALANERIGEFYVSHGLDTDAQFYFWEAIRCFGEWGSSQRGDVILNRHTNLLSKAPPSSFAFQVDGTRSISHSSGKIS